MQQLVGYVINIQIRYGGVHKCGGSPIAGWFIRENSMNMDYWGYPPSLRKPQYEIKLRVNRSEAFLI